MARIPGFHPGGPGSIPGVGDHYFLHADVCDLRLDFEIFDIRPPTAVDQADTTDNCPDSMVVEVGF